MGPVNEVGPDVETERRVETQRIIEYKSLILADERQRVLDLVLPAAPENGWCDEVLQALHLVYPEVEIDPDRRGQGWYTSQGLDLYGRDVDGYDLDGYDDNGLNREGYDRNGYGPDGLNKAGERHGSYSEHLGLTEWCTDCHRYHRQGQM